MEHWLHAPPLSLCVCYTMTERMGCIQQNNLKVMFVKQKKMLIFTEMESSDEAMMKKYSNIWAILVVFFITWIHQLYCSNYPTYIIKKKIH